MKVGTYIYVVGIVIAKYNYVVIKLLAIQNFFGPHA